MSDTVLIYGNLINEEVEDPKGEQPDFVIKYIV